MKPISQTTSKAKSKPEFGQSCVITTIKRTDKAEALQ